MRKESKVIKTGFQRIEENFHCWVNKMSVDKGFNLTWFEQNYVSFSFLWHRQKDDNSFFTRLNRNKRKPSPCQRVSRFEFFVKSKQVKSRHFDEISSWYSCNKITTTWIQSCEYKRSDNLDFSIFFCEYQASTLQWGSQISDFLLFFGNQFWSLSTPFSQLPFGTLMPKILLN